MQSKRIGGKSMAGINVPQYDIFKINTAKLNYYNWNLTISKHEAFLCGEIVSLFEAQEFRLISLILNKPIDEVDFSKYIFIAEVATKSDFKRITTKGFTVNGILFKRFVGTPNGLKHNTLMFVNVEVLDELNRRCDCGRKEIPIIPSKLEAYKSLSCSASQPICSPRGILVVPDCITHIVEDVINIDCPLDSADPKILPASNEKLENNIADGFSICTVDYMKRVSESLGLDYVPGGVCLRNAWFKGMLYPFPIMEFFDKYYDKETVTDIWGNEHSIHDIEMITTESSLKLWKAYDSIDDYIRLTIENGYTWAVTKISPRTLDDERELNYQYLQSYDFDDEDIKELCSPTVKYLKDALCGDYESTIKFLGITVGSEPNSWQQALYEAPFMLGDPFIIDSVYRMIRKKIDQAKIGKLLVKGNYQICSGDPFLLMEHVCSLPLKGLLKAGEIYSDYWSNRNVTDVVVFRSPMTSHNNIRRCVVATSSDLEYWYQYMHGIMILNGWDTMCQALNGEDFDGDINFSTDNPTLLNRYRYLPALICIQHNAEKVIPTEDDIIKSNWNGMGNQVGTITNRITTMMEVQSHFPQTSTEYNELNKRIQAGQHFQQLELDKIKGIIAEPMPKYWYDSHKCENDFQRSICADKKPYFMIYVYDDYKAKYNKYIKDSRKQQLLEYGDVATPDKEFLDYKESRNPFGMGPCAMNRICWYIEDEFRGCVSKIKRTSTFDYRVLKYDVPYSSDLKAQVQSLANEYAVAVHENIKKNDETSREDGANKKRLIQRYYKEQVQKLVPNEKERYEIIIDLYYGNTINRQFCWDTIGELIIKRLRELQ